MPSTRSSPAALMIWTCENSNMTSGPSAGDYALIDGSFSGGTVVGDKATESDLRFTFEGLMVSWPEPVSIGSGGDSCRITGLVETESCEGELRTLDPVAATNRLGTDASSSSPGVPQIDAAVLSSPLWFAADIGGLISLPDELTRTRRATQSAGNAFFDMGGRTSDLSDTATVSGGAFHFTNRYRASRGTFFHPFSRLHEIEITATTSATYQTTSFNSEVIARPAPEPQTELLTASIVAFLPRRKFSRHRQFNRAWDASTALEPWQPMFPQEMN